MLCSVIILTEKTFAVTRDRTQDSCDQDSGRLVSLTNQPAQTVFELTTYRIRQELEVMCGETTLFTWAGALV